MHAFFSHLKSNMVSFDLRIIFRNGLTWMTVVQLWCIAYLCFSVLISQIYLWVSCFAKLPNEDVGEKLSNSTPGGKLTNTKSVSPGTNLKWWRIANLINIFVRGLNEIAGLLMSITVLVWFLPLGLNFNY